MNVNVQPPWPARGRAIALHCSGAGASQWRCLAEALGAEYDLSAPEHYGCESRGPWTGEHAFTLADEATSALALIDAASAANPKFAHHLRQPRLRTSGSKTALES